MPMAPSMSFMPPYSFCATPILSKPQCFAQCTASKRVPPQASQVIPQLSHMCQRRDTAFGPTYLSSQAMRPDDTPQHTAVVAMVHLRCPSALQVSPDRSASLSSPAATMWNTDTGASAHMSPHRHWFHSYSPHSIPIRLTNSHIVYSVGMGL